MGSFACQHVPSCLSNQLFVHDPSGGLSRHTSRDATPTPQIPAHFSCYIYVYLHIFHVIFMYTCTFSCYIYAYLHIFRVIFMHTCTYFMLYLCILAHLLYILKLKVNFQSNELKNSK